MRHILLTIHVAINTPGMLEASTYGSVVRKLYTSQATQLAHMATYGSGLRLCAAGKQAQKPRGESLCGACMLQIGSTMVADVGRV